MWAVHAADTAKKGRSWSYAYLLNLAAQTGVQVLVSFSGDIAVRGKWPAAGNGTNGA